MDVMGDEVMDPWLIVRVGLSDIWMLHRVKEVMFLYVYVLKTVHRHGGRG